MILGQVVGNVVATVKDEQLTGVKLLLVRFLDRQRNPVGRPVAAIDVVQAGPGDVVFLVRAREAALATYPVVGPADLAIVGIVEELTTVDHLDLEWPVGDTYFT